MRLTDRMRVLLVPSVYYPSVGGVEEHVRNLAHQLLDRGHDVQVWTSRSAGDDLPEHDLVAGVVIRRWTFPAPRSSPAALLAWPGRALPHFVALRRALRAYSPDLINVHCFSTNGAYATALSRTTGVPLVVSLHGETFMDDQDVYSHSTFLQQALRAGLRRAAVVTGCSRLTLTDAEQRFGLATGRGVVVPNGVDLEETDVEPVALPWPNFALAVGRAVENKGFDLLLRAFCVGAGSGTGLVIAGDGPELPGLRKQVTALGLNDRVVLTGSMGRAQVTWLMRHAQLVVMPSRREPFGIVFLEAWRAGTPVIVTDRGGALEFVTDGQDALVVDPTDTDALSEALRRLFSQESLRDHLASHGLSAVGRFSWTEVASRYEDVYAVASGPGRPGALGADGAPGR